MGLAHYFIAFLFILTCILLMLVVLLQKGRGGGLSGAFGGTGGHSAFGAKTGDVFTWITVGLAVAFVIIACVGNFVFEPPTSASQQTPTEGLAPMEGETEESPAASPEGTSEGQPAQSESATPPSEGE
jgi:preprotein translocase subunit SecG